MQKIYLMLKNTEIPFVTSMYVQSFFRSESRLMNLAGDEITYRGNKKYSVSFMISYASPAIISLLDSAVDDTYFTARFYDNNTLVTTEMRLTPPTVSPRYLYGQRARGVYYINTPIVLTER